MIDQPTPDMPISVRFAEFGMALANVSAHKMSKDPSTKVGACIMSEDKRRTYCAWNGFPAGITDDDRLRDRQAKYARVMHAEKNAIDNAGRDCNGGYLFVTLMPCSGAESGHNCAGSIIQNGIQAVFVLNDATEEVKARWSTSQAIAIEMMHEAGIRIFQMNLRTKRWNELEPSPPKSSTTASSGSSTSWAMTPRLSKALGSLTAKALKKFARMRG